MTFARGAGCWLLLAAIFCCGPRQARGEPPAAGAATRGEFVDVLGKKYRLPGPDDCKAVALIFVGHDCPISNGYAPEVVRLCKEYAPKKVAFCVVYADADLTRDDARKHAREHGYCCPALLDPEMVLARKAGATVKPEAAVLSPKGEVLYRGRIDDLYVEIGKKRARPTSRDLKDALDAVLAGKPVPTPRTKAIGCYIDLPETDK
jgi:hypothetical protein